MLPKCHPKSKKIVFFVGPGCICNVFYGFWEESKNHEFSMSLWVVPLRAQVHPLADLSIHPGFCRIQRVPTGPNGSQPGIPAKFGAGARRVGWYFQHWLFKPEKTPTRSTARRGRRMFVFRENNMVIDDLRTFRFWTNSSLPFFCDWTTLIDVKVHGKINSNDSKVGKQMLPMFSLIWFCRHLVGHTF